MIRYKLTQHDHSVFALGKYYIEYKNGTIIQAPENTLGFMLFQELQDVYFYIELMGLKTYNFHERGYAIKVIETLDTETFPYTVSSGVYELAIDFFYKNQNKLRQLGEYTTLPPPGTVCCSKIKIIKDYMKG